ncbi:MAG: T9SS type A sorting domain-containing protein [Bacteroidales bacterium]|nr:T9SS type A sorting domain-containing protein [Bacteroidales bacterium]
MMQRVFIPFMFFILFFAFCNAQGVAVGEWRDHLPYSSVIDVATAPDRVYAATEYGLFYYDTYEGTITRMSKVEGLSDIGISAIEYSDKYDMLIVSYSNANIDLIPYEGDLYNLADIKRKNIIGNKSINNIYLQDDYAYLSCGFGIVVLNLNKKEIKDTYYIGDNGSQVNVLDITFNDSLIFAATDEGIYTADINSPNLAYFGNWNKDISIANPNGMYSEIEFFENSVYTLHKNPVFGDDTIYYYQNNIWQTFSYFSAEEFTSLKSSNNQLIVCGYSWVEFFDQGLSSLGKTFTYSGLSPQPNAAEYSTDGVYVFIGDQNYGLLKTWNIWNNEIIMPEGPYTSNTFSLDLTGNVISGVNGGYNSSYGNSYRGAGFFIFNEEDWTSYYRFVNPELDTLFDFICIETANNDPDHIYLGSYGQGLIEYNDGSLVQIYNSENSNLQPVQSSSNVNVGGLSFDDDGNLWITTMGNTGLLSVLKPDGSIRTFNFPSSYSASVSGDIEIDQSGYKWINLPRGEGIVVFNDNGTIDNTSDDEYKKLTSSESLGNLPNLYVNAIAVDRDNEIWIGTNEGIAVIYNPENVFDGGDYDAQQILVEVGGYVQPLLESEIVTCIAIDGGNRKWIGTNSAGVFLISEDGQTEIHHFSTDNSPLLSDEINDLKIHPETGEVFIATSEGIISYRGTATEPEENLDSILIFPNPVKSDFNGYVSINNLVENAWVHITDMYGNLIYKTQAYGGQAVWNCIDIDGTRPATGIYLVFVSSKDGSFKNVGKFMFFN